MTRYEKELVRMVEQRFPDLSPAQLLPKLMEMGVVDSSRCKVLAVRRHVETLMRVGGKKTDAMWAAADYFACSYEYVRKCMYYYVDVNFC